MRPHSKLCQSNWIGQSMCVGGGGGGLAPLRTNRQRSWTELVEMRELTHSESITSPCAAAVVGVVWVGFERGLGLYFPPSLCNWMKETFCLLLQLSPVAFITPYPDFTPFLFKELVSIWVTLFHRYTPLCTTAVQRIISIQIIAILWVMNHVSWIVMFKSSVAWIWFIFTVWILLFISSCI